MIESLSFSYATPVHEHRSLEAEVSLEVVGRESDGSVAFEDDFQCSPRGANVGPLLLEVDRVLRGEPIHLLKCSHDLVWISLTEREGAVALDVVDLQDESRSHLEAPVPVRREAVVDGLLEFAREHAEQLQRAQGPSGSVSLKLRVGIAHAGRSLQYYEEHGSMEGFEPTIDGEHLEAFAREWVDNDDLRQFVLRTDDLRPFARGLADREDDEVVAECYYNLLSFYKELCEPTAEALAEHSDERARKGLIGAFFSSHRSPTVIRALAPIADANAIRSAGGLLSRVDEPLEDRQEAARLLETAPVQELLDERELEELLEYLEDAREATEDDALRERVEQLLAAYA